MTLVLYVQGLYIFKIFLSYSCHHIGFGMNDCLDIKSLQPLITNHLFCNEFFSEHVKMEVCYEDPCKKIIEGEMKKVETIYEGTMKGNIV